MSKSNKCPMVKARAWDSIEHIADASRKAVFATKQDFLKRGAMFELFENGKLNLLGISDYGVENLPLGDEGKFTPETSSLVLSENTYEKLSEAEGRANFTLAHEIGHAVLHGQELKKASSARTAYTQFHRKDIPAYRDPECQANQFAAAFLMPKEFIIEDIQSGMTTFDISKKYNVSHEAATHRKNYILKKYNHML